MNEKISNKDLRVFGVIWAIIFAYLAYKFSSFEKIFALFALFFTAVSALNPQFFVKIKIYQNWIKFGNILGKINGFLISFILFYAIFTPISFFLKITKKDLLKKSLKPESSTYFIDRELQPGDMKNQF